MLIALKFNAPKATQQTYDRESDRYIVPIQGNGGQGGHEGVDGGQLQVIVGQENYFIENPGLDLVVGNPEQVGGGGVGGQLQVFVGQGDHLIENENALNAFVDNPKQVDGGGVAGQLQGFVGQGGPLIQNAFDDFDLYVANPEQVPAADLNNLNIDIDFDGHPWFDRPRKVLVDGGIEQGMLWWMEEFVWI